MHPFVALMRRYAIDYTNSHDQTTYPDLFTEDYTVHISGVDLVRDESYGPAARSLFDAAPGLGLVVHELILNGDRLCMRFSEHAAMPRRDGTRALACWRGIGLYDWNGTHLVENHVEQDFMARRRQITSGVPDALEPPHLDPWMTTEPVPADAEAEAVVRDALTAGRLLDAASVLVDDATGDEAEFVVDTGEVTINDLFSAGRRVAVHATIHGTYRGGVDGVPSEAIGADADLYIAALVAVADDGELDEVRAVTTREQVLVSLRSQSR